MISFLRGTIAALFVDSVVIEVGGIGYRVSMSGKSLSRLGHVGEEVKVLTRLQVRDDALVLYGFLNHDEEKLFAKLTSVSSVGPKVALSALSTYEPEALVSAIVSQDVGAIQQIPGVGKKMASRIALELKESFRRKRQMHVRVQWKRFFPWVSLRKKPILHSRGLPRKQTKRYYCNTP